jgi:hypothetical protein
VRTRLGVGAVRADVEARAGADTLARTGIGDLEIGYSARRAADWDQLMSALGIFRLVETTG